MVKFGLTILTIEPQFGQMVKKSWSLDLIYYLQITSSMFSNFHGPKEHSKLVNAVRIEQTLFPSSIFWT
jgi:hypothetical protein